MKISKEQGQLIRLLVETTTLQGEELEQAWELLEKIEQYDWQKLVAVHVSGASHVYYYEAQK